jgi:carboxypeptidase family protein
MRIVVSAALAAVLVACAPSASNAPGSGVSGVAVAGPICPVVTDPPQSGCDDRPVEGADLVIVDDSGDRVATVTTGEDGSFAVDLPPGSYRLQPQPVAGLMGTAPEATFTVTTGGSAELTVSYDTGIR